MTDKVDLLIARATLLATMDEARRELPGGWVAITDGVIVGVGDASTPAPEATRTIDASGCLVTPGFVNTHHHIYQNLTRAYRPATSGTLFPWLQTLYPLWSRIDEESVHVSAWVGFAELALGGCTTTMDHLYVHPAGGGDLITAEVAAAHDIGMRFHATRGSMSLSEKDGGLPPDSVVQDDDTILAESERLVHQHHDRSAHALIQVALAPCSPFSVTKDLMRRTAELAEKLDVRLHTHLAEDPDEDVFCMEQFGCRPLEYFEDVGWGSSRAWVAHCVHPNDEEVVRLGRWGTGVAHCPSSNLMLGVGLCRVHEMWDAGVPVGLGCDGSASTDSASLWMEARNAMLIGRTRKGPARMGAREALELATRGGAQVLGRAGQIGELTVGACGDVAVWGLDGVVFAGAIDDPIEALLRCGPTAPRHTIVAGRPLVEDGRLVSPRVDEMLAEHRRHAERIQGVSS